MCRIAVALSKQTQHCWHTTPDTVGFCMLRPFAHPVACCWVLIGVAAQNLKLVKILSQQLPTFLLLRDRSSVAQQSLLCLHRSSMIRATHAHYGHNVWSPWCLQSLMGCILSQMHWRFFHRWMLSYAFARHCTNATSPNNIGLAMFGVFASVCT